jgi:hypothetical protein
MIRRSIHILDHTDRTVGDVNSVVDGVVATVGWHGGYKTYTMRIYGTSAFLQTIRSQWLGYSVRERYDGVTWAGVIVQIDHVTGYTRTRTGLYGAESRVVNAVQVSYDGGSQLTGWYEDLPSISAYGRIEHRYKIESPDPIIANLYAQTMLGRYGTPQTVVVSMGDTVAEKPYCEITAWGYQITAAKRIATSTLSIPTSLSNAFIQTVAVDAGMAVGVVDSTTMLIDPSDFDGDTAAKRIEKIIQFLPNRNLRLYVDENRRYNFVLTTPQIYVLTREGVRQRLGGPLLPIHQIGPGIYRDETAQPPTTAFVDEIARRDGRNRPELRSISLDWELH